MKSIQEILRMQPEQWSSYGASIQAELDAHFTRSSFYGKVLTPAPAVVREFRDNSSLFSENSPALSVVVIAKNSSDELQHTFHLFTRCGSCR